MENSHHRPNCKTYPIELPLCCLNIMEAGSGEPLVIVPATISLLENWVDLIQFMAQWFHVYFFELPGHGLSTPFQEKFSTTLVAQTVEQLVDQLQFERFNLMGFSFGGILAMRCYDLLQDRIDHLILNAPCLTTRAVKFSPAQRLITKSFSSLLSRRSLQERLIKSFRHPKQRHSITNIFHRFGKFENRTQVEQKLAVLQISTLAVLTEEVNEIMGFEFPHPEEKYKTPCFFAMSIHDPLLDYEITLREVQSNFSNVRVTELYYPFHQPPQPFTFEELNRDFKESVNKYLS